MTISTVLGEVEDAGIALRLEGRSIRIWFPEAEQRETLAAQIAFLRAHRDEVTEFLLARGGSGGARSPLFWGVDREHRPRGYYGWRAHIALDAIRATPSPEGLMVWLGEHAPALYRELIQVLPNKISRGWNSQISCTDFDTLCLDLVKTYQRAAELYRG